MADEPTPVTTDVAGLARTADGTLATPPLPETTKPAEVTTPKPETPAPKPEVKAGDKKDGEGDTSLLNKDAKKPDDGKSTGAPEKYEEYKVPEGFTLDPEVKTQADKLFKGMNLSQDQAQSLVDFYAAKAKEAFDAPFNAYQDQRKEWREAAEQNPELKGKLGPGGEVLTIIGRALDSLGDPQLANDFRQAMDMTGAGDNPAFILAFFRMSQRLVEGSHVTGRGPAVSGQQRPNQPARSVAQDLWPNLPSQSQR